MNAMYVFIAGLVLCALGILMIFGQPSFLLVRYEWFQKLFRKTMTSANRKTLSKWYAILFLVTGLPLSIGAIVGYIVPDTFELFSLWLLVTVGIIGIIIVLYINVSKRFIIYEGKNTSD
ncbi:MAG: hypothetical protein ACTSXK_10850 [Promethearchaeota archaeon]